MLFSFFSRLRLGAWVLVCLGLALLSAHVMAQATGSGGYTLTLIKAKTPLYLLNSAQLPLDAVNATRGDNQLVLYTSNFGSSTRTNPHGVEVIAAPAPGDVATQEGPLYTVEAITSVWDCQKLGGSNPSLNLKGLPCGNGPLTQGRVVLSATGNRRQLLLNTFEPGSEFRLKRQYFSQASTPLSGLNPNAQTNPVGRTYPGFRASGQLLAYTGAYGQPTTGTNEFGTEVTVINNRVVAAEGADSTIPAAAFGSSFGDLSSFILSGHGPMRTWLVQNAPLGAKIELLPQTSSNLEGLLAPLPTLTGPVAYTVLSSVDFETYQLQIKSQLEKLNCNLSPVACQNGREALQKAQALHTQNQDDAAIALLLAQKPTLDKTRWAQHPRYSVNATKAVWHRPVELSPQAIGTTLDRFKQAGLNTVFLETFFHGWPLFNSKTYAAYGLKGTLYPKFRTAALIPSGAPPGTLGPDPLRVWLNEAHKRGMQLHPWVQVFYVGNRQVDGPGPILEAHPDWANVQRSALKTGEDTLMTPEKPVPSTLEPGSYFLDPANPNVQTFLLALMDELLNRYPVDGLQLDYIRYPASFPPDRYSYLATTWGYTPVARQGFEATYGTDPARLTPQNLELWEAWATYKAEQINSFVRLVHQRVVQARAKNPRLQLSAAVFPDSAAALANKHQQWGLWGQEGLVDFLAPMNLSGATALITQHTREMTQVAGVPVVAGIFGPFNQMSAESTLEQLEAAKAGGAVGYSLFDSAHLSPDTVEALTLWQTQPL